MIIDGLTHLTRSGTWLDHRLDSSVDELLRQMDAAHVDVSIVTALQNVVSDDDVASLCRLHPDRLIGFAAPPIGDPTASSMALQRAVEAGFRGIKLHPRRGLFDASSPLVFDLVGEAVERGLPVMLCSLCDDRGQIDHEPPHLVLGRWADAFPDHPFILAHAGSHRILDAWEMARHRENTYLDLSHTLHYFRGSSVEQDIGFVARRLDRRVLFGSDFPESSIEAALEAFQRCLAPWPDADQARILGGTWQAILGL